jgi:hypothetical protein
MRGASGDECGNLVLGQEYNRPAEAGVLKKPRGSDFNFNFSTTHVNVRGRHKYNFTFTFTI